ncbi:hypothetical protein [Nesterenkonia populi]|uniref:hypothetical protein n=1 Tax=Nesterenkonia populi TaxID=1591087 RepID=UPI0011BE4E29|nr:hypothetical protein [Nesterenkonia populi]
MRRHFALLSASALLLAGCGTDDTSPETATAGEDPFEDIPDDAPIHDMDDDDIYRHMFDCDDDLSTEECMERHEAEVEEQFDEAEFELCADHIAEYEEQGMSWASCHSARMPNEEFYDLYEERTGEEVPEHLRAPDHDDTD